MGLCEVWYKVDNLKSLNKPLKIGFCIGMYGQKCKKCFKMGKQEYAKMAYDAITD